MTLTLGPLQQDSVSGLQYSIRRGAPAQPVRCLVLLHGVGSNEANMLAFSGVMQVAEIIRTETGGEMPWITADDTSNEGEFIGEAESIDGSTDPDIGAQMWYAYKVHAKMIKVSHELIEDNARLTAEHAQLVAANQALATENARLVKRDQEARRIIEDADLCGGDIDRPAARAFLAGEGKP